VAVNPTAICFLQGNDAKSTNFTHYLADWKNVKFLLKIVGKMCKKGVEIAGIL